MKDSVEAFKTDSLADNAKIMRLQGKLLENKGEQDLKSRVGDQFVVVE